MSKINSDIEVLRGIAILLTMFGHLRRLFFWGSPTFEKIVEKFVFWGGVDLFFCISGFVIMRSFIMQSQVEVKEKTNFFLFAAPFWIRRAWRLWPSAMFWVGFSLMAAKWFNQSGAFGLFSYMFFDVVAAIMQIANLHWLGCHYYKVGTCNGLDVYWSLSLEEQFYFVFPFFLFFLPRRMVIPVLLILAICQVIVFRPAWSPGWAIRTDAILLGVLLAIWKGHASYTKFEPAIFQKRWVSRFVALLLLLMILKTPSNAWVGGFSTGILALLSAGLVWIASYDKNYIWSAGRFTKILIWMGARSYSLYLIHVPAFALTREVWFRVTPVDVTIGPNFTLRFIITAIFIMVILSEINYQIIEQPLRNYGRKVANKFFQNSLVQTRTPTTAKVNKCLKD